jgi:hypothetical protein
MHFSFFKKTIALALFFAMFGGLRAQGWQWKYGDADHAETCTRAIQTPDGGYLAVTIVDQSDGNFVFHRFDAAGHELWSRTIFQNGFGGLNLRNIVNAPNGGFEVAGSIYETANFVNLHPMIWRFDSLGTTLDLKIVPIDTAGVIKAERFSDGSWLMHLSTYNPNLIPNLIKVAPDGSIVWQQHYTNFELLDIAVAPNDQIFIASKDTASYNYWLNGLSAEGNIFWEKPILLPGVNTQIFTPVKINATNEAVFIGAAGVFNNSTSSNVFFQKRSVLGDSIWSLNMSNFIQQPDFYSGGFSPNSDGGATFYSSHVEYPNNITTRFTDLTKVTTDGSVVWTRPFRDLLVSDMARTSDDGFLMAGINLTDANFSTYDAWLVKTDSLGILFKNAISGKIARDANQNCQVDSSELLLKNWVIEAKKLDGTQFFANTDATGNYFMPLDTGNYLLNIQPINQLWESCDTNVTISLSNSYDTVSTNFSVLTLADCPLLRVDLTASFFRRCFSSGGSVAFCNQGTATAIGATVRLIFNNLVTFESASVPFTQLAPGDFLFQIGDVAALECGQFSFQYFVSCDAVLGQTLCISAQIKPDSFCISPPNWSGASLVADALCESDSIRLLLKNIGSGNMTAPQEFIIVEDEVLMLMAPFQLISGDSVIVRLPANGSMRRIQSLQVANHPAPGMVNASAENCGSAAQNFGFWLQYPQDDGWPFSERECRQVVGSFDPNDKSATPLGYGPTHQILPRTDLEYLINFQNTGTDTAFTVVIRDTLSAFLDPASVRIGAASHAVEWQLTGQNELIFSFKNILLADSFVNEKASHGFVSFKISQKNDVSLGSVIENNAAIFFDFNDPIITNTVFHTIDTGFVKILIPSKTTESTTENFSVFPNPTRAGDYLFFEKNTFGQLRLTDVFGKIILVKNIFDAPIRLPSDISAGTYFLFFENKKGVKRAGRLVIF